MLEIAQASGLVQSSLYYWFRRKELIVSELLQQINRQPLAYARTLRFEGGTPDIQLYRLVRFDVLNVCKFPLEITEIHRFASRDEAAFATYWHERRELTLTVQRLIEDGMAFGSFRRVNAQLCALTIIAQNESVQNWLPRTPPDPGKPAPARAAKTAELPPSVVPYTPEQIADFVATQTLAGLVAAESKLATIRKRACMS